MTEEEKKRAEYSLYLFLRMFEGSWTSHKQISELARCSEKDAKVIILGMFAKAPGDDMLISIYDDEIVLRCGLPSVSPRLRKMLNERYDEANRMTENAMSAVQTALEKAASTK